MTILQISTTDAPGPLLSIDIHGRAGIAFVDSSAQTSIASSRLYKFLKTGNADFVKSKLRVAFADGVPREEDVPRVRAPIRIVGCKFATDFVILSRLKKTITLC